MILNYCFDTKYFIGKTNAKNYCRSPGDFEPKCPISKTSLKKCGIKQCSKLKIFLLYKKLSK